MAEKSEKKDPITNISQKKDEQSSSFRIFISYSHVDENFKDELVKHLSPFLLLGRAEIWSDRQIKAGSRLYEVMQDNIESAHIILMIISSDYISSNACQREMSVALTKSLDGSSVAIPIVVRSCNWTILPIGDLLAANEDAKPINSQPDRDVAWTQVSRKIGEIVNDWEVQHSGNNTAVEGELSSAALGDDQSLQPADPGRQGERWVNRRVDNDAEWEQAKQDLIDELTNAADAEDNFKIPIFIRRWGEKIIVDFTLPQHRNPRRLLIRDIGGEVGYPGYQLEIYSSDERTEIGHSRVRWLLSSEGTRVLRQVYPAIMDLSTREYAQNIWHRIVSLAK